MTLRERLEALAVARSVPKFMRDYQGGRDALTAIALAAAKMAWERMRA